MIISDKLSDEMISIVFVKAVKIEKIGFLVSTAQARKKMRENIN